MKHQIKHRHTETVLFECDLPDETPSVMAVRLSLEQATASDANLSGANLSGSSLRGVDLSGVDLSDVDLSGANLSGSSLRGASLRGVDLSGVDLSGASLGDVKNDFWEILLRAPREITGLRAALVAGKVNGSTYEGACACLVGTIANVRGHVDYRDLGNGLIPNESRPAERWFMGIKTGDTPKTNQISEITVAWLDEFAALLEAAKVPT